MNASAQKETAAGAPMDCLGVDVAKATFDASFVGVERAGSGVRPGELAVRTFPRTREGAAAAVAWMEEQRPEGRRGLPARVTMEATGPYSSELAKWFCSACALLVPSIVNPHDAAHHRRSLAPRNNTDALAARALALFGLERQPRPYEPMAPERVELRELSRHRDDVVKARTALKNRMGEPSASAWVRSRQTRELRRLDREVEGAEKRIEQHLGRHPELKAEIDRLDTVDGVGRVTAVAVAAEMGDLRAFGRARQMGAFAGLSPQHNESGSSVRGKPRMCKKGNGRVRTALYMAALSAVRKDNPFRDLYRRLVAGGLAPRAALGAVMRKMLVVMRAMLIGERDYDPGRRSGGKTCGKLGPEPTAA